MNTYAVVFFGAALLALVLTPLIVRLARRLNVLDDPGVRKVHAAAIPRLGGVAIVLPMLALTLPVFILPNAIGQFFRDNRAQLLVFFATSFAVFLVGVMDDIWGLRARTKFACQFLAAAAFCGSGMLIDRINLTESFSIEFGWFAVPITLLWIVGITNAVNLIDGLDGLAAGISLITCAVMAVVAISAGRPVMAVVMLGLAGSLVGFLVYNFNPARIFLGDGGSLFLGYVLATASVLTSSKTSTVVALALPLLTLGVPIFDTLFSMVRRVSERRSMFSPDRAHIHHRLLDRGLAQRKAVLLLYGVTAAAAGLGLLMILVQSTLQLVLFLSALLFLLVVFRMTGVISLRDTLIRLRRNQELARDLKVGKNLLQQAELELREADTLQGWCSALWRAAEALEFAELTLAPLGPGLPCGPFCWRCGDEEAVEHAATIAYDARGADGAPLLRVRARIANGRSFESVARRTALFGRLVDEFPISRYAIHEAGAAAPGPVGAPEAGVLHKI